jgi:outer membrane protein assembly factor BamE (lipoprotein component of BamABCDE complex)
MKIIFSTPSRTSHAATQTCRTGVGAALALAFIFALPLSAAATAPVASSAEVSGQQAEGFGPLDPAPPSGLTADQIVERMGKRESEFATARNDYVFTQSVKINTISDDTGRPDGEYQQVTNITFNDKGVREERVVFAPQNTLERIIMTPTDFDEIVNRLPFILTTEQLPQYDLTYLGRQRVDELDTYVFDVKPKRFEKGHHYFQGKAWVDQTDFQIVVVNGMTVPQDTRRGHEDLQPPFTTYYQQIDGKYWFPTYTKAEGTLHFAAQQGALSEDIHMRNIIRYTDYKRFRANVTIHYNGEEISNKPDATPQPDASKPNASKPPQ